MLIGLALGQNARPRLGPKPITKFTLRHPPPTTHHHHHRNYLKGSRHIRSLRFDMQDLPRLVNRFLGQFWKDANCHGDICPSDICPYQEFLNCFLPNFDQTFWTQFLIFVPIFFYKTIYMTKKNLDQKFFIPNVLDPNLFGPIYFW